MSLLSIIDNKSSFITFNQNDSISTEFSNLISMNETLETQKQTIEIIDNYNLTNSIYTTKKSKQFNKSTSTEEIPISNDKDTSLEPDSMAILKSMLENEDYENGIVNPSEIYFRKLFLKNKIDTMNGLSRIFVDSYSSDGRKINNLIGILHLLSHATYSEVYPVGQMLAISAISHKNNEVAEFGIKCFENWENADGIEKLEAIKFSTHLLQLYANEVINDLRGIS